jgi:hypothetical protein
MATEYKLPYTGQEISNKLGKVDEAVRYTSQTLTDAQKSQVRENIGAMGEEAIENLVVTAIANANELTNISATFEEIYEAYNAGRNISLHIQTPSGTTTMLPCTSIDADNAFFDAVTAIAGQNTIHSAIIFSDDTSSYTSSAIDGGGAEETDPTVPEWAKAATKPAYTAAEVGALPDTTKIPTKTSELTNDSGFLTQHQSLSGYAKTADHYTKTESDSKYQTKGNYLTSVPSEYVTETELTAKGYLTQHQSLEGYAKTADLGALATKDTVAKTDLATAVQTSLGKADTALQSYTETDPTVPSWAKASSKPTYTKSEVGLGNVDNVKQYSASNPPPYPVTSVNGKTGAVDLTTDDMGRGDANFELLKGNNLTAILESADEEIEGLSTELRSKVPTSRKINGKALTSDITLSASDVGADATGTASSAVSAHNTSAAAHSGIREQINQLSSEREEIKTSVEELQEQIDNITNDSTYVKSVNGILPDETGNVTVTVTAQQPDFVVKDTLTEALEWLNENGDSSKVYVLPDGYIYAFMQSETEVDVSVNALSSAVGYLGTTLNDVGYIDDYYISGTAYVSGNNSYLSTSQDTTHFVTGFIPFVVQDGKDVEPIYIKGVTIDINNLNSHTRLNMYPTYNFTESNSPKNFSDLISNESISIEQLGEQEYRIIFTENFYYALNSNVKTQGANYIRFSLPGSGEGVFIRIGERKTETVITDCWASTGQAFVSTDYGDRIVELESSVAANSTKIASLEIEITNLHETIDDIPSYWKSELETKAIEICKVMGTAGRNKSAFLWYTDSHWNVGDTLPNNYRQSPKLLKYLYDNTPINKVNFGGDIVQFEASDANIDDAVEMSYLYEWRKAIRCLQNHHSVVGNHDDGTHNNHFADEFIYSYLLAPEENDSIVYGDDFYYYIDDKAEKTRYLYLDTAYKEATDSQIEFVANALTTTPENWHIVAIAHKWHEAMYTVEQGDYLGDYSASASKFLQMFYAYNHRENGSIDNISYDFTNANGKFEFCIGGHTHWDATSYFNNEILVILTATDSTRTRVDGIACVQGTTTENAVNAIIADYNNNQVSVIRVGRGSSRVVEIKSVLSAAYTNVLSTTIE